MNKIDVRIRIPGVKTALGSGSTYMLTNNLPQVFQVVVYLWPHFVSLLPVSEKVVKVCLEILKSVCCTQHLLFSLSYFKASCCHLTHLISISISSMFFKKNADSLTLKLCLRVFLTIYLKGPAIEFDKLPQMRQCAPCRGLGGHRSENPCDAPVLPPETWTPRRTPATLKKRIWLWWKDLTDSQQYGQ